MATRYYFVTNNRIAQAWDENGDRQSNDDRNLQTILGLSGTESISGAAVTDNRIGFLVIASGNSSIRVLDHSFNRVSSEDITGISGAHVALGATNNRWVIVSNTNQRAEYYTFTGTHRSSEGHSLPGTWGGCFTDGTYIYFVQFSTGLVSRRTYTSSTLSRFLNLGSGNWISTAATSTRFLFNSSGSIRVYNHSGVRQTREEFVAVSGSAGFAVDIADDATFTISATDTDIRAGEQVNINISSDIDISGFTATDITVSGGTRGALTRTDARNYVLAVTAGTAGTLTISIAGDVVDPGNNAASQNFTINARISATISFDKTRISAGESTQVTVNFSESTDQFIASELSASAGTLSGFSGSGSTYTATLTAPSTGSGTITVSIPADAVTAGGLGNVAVSQDIAYQTLSDLVVTISGTDRITQGQTTTLTATVTDADGNTITSGLSYSWDESRGIFNGATNEASIVYNANFAETTNIDVIVTCNVTRAYSGSPTVSTASLTAMTMLGITGQLVNMYLTATRAVVANSNNALYQEGSHGTLAVGSDADLSSDIHFWRVRWNSDSNRLILNNNSSGSLATFYTSNTAQSLYLIFEDGTYVEIPNSQILSTGTTWVQWGLPSEIQTRFNNWDGTQSLLIGIADAGSISDGVPANSGSDDITITTLAAVAPPSEATFSISTSDTNILARESVNIDISSDIDITGFIATDITVSGGTRGTLTRTDARNYVLAVTAGNAGTLTISIAGDVVSPGNNAASQNFTIHASAVPITLSITATDITKGETVTVTATAASDVTGIALSDFSVDAGTVQNFQATSARVYTVDVVMPSTGTGTVTVTLEQNAAVETNAAATIEIAYGIGVTLSIDNSNISNGEVGTVTATFGRAPTGIAQNDFSTDVGTLENFRGSGTIYMIDIRVPNVGSGSGTITLLLDAATEGSSLATIAFSYSDDSVFIEVVDVQNILVDTEDYELMLATRNVQASHKVSAIGDWDNGFYHAFDQSTGQIMIKNPRVERLETQKNWRFLVEDAGAVLAERDVGYNVVPEVPVIGQVERQTIYKGLNYNIFIPVTGIPAEARIRGNLIGAKSVATHEGGVTILGNLPAGANIDFTEFEAPLYVANNAGSHQRNIPFAISEGTPTDVPGSLSNVSASAQGTSIRFSWNPPISDGGLEVLDYEVKIGDGQWIPKGLSARSHTFTGLTAGQSYTVYGRSRNADGYSAEVSRTVVIPGQVPDDISVLLIPSGAPDFTVSKRVSFGAVSGASSYQIRYGSGQWTTTGRTHSTSSRILPGNETISVRAINQHGYGPARSYSYSANAIPFVPTFTRNNLSVANGQITATWSLPSSGAGWGNQPVYVRTLVYEGSNGHQANGSVTTYTITGLTNGNGYNISVRSVVSSTDGRVTIYSYPGDSYSIAIFNTPTITRQQDSRSSNTFTYSYTPLSDEIPFELQYSIDGGSTWRGVNTAGDGIDGTGYTFMARAADSNGIGGPIAEIRIG